MEVTRLRSFLRRHRRIALDTSIFIYQFEGNPRYIALTDIVFGWLEHPHNEAVTSTMTMTELLVQPYRNGDRRWVHEFYALLATYPNLQWIAPGLEIADIAARLRAEHRLRTPDALLAATAIHSQSGGLITNDPVFERVNSFDSLMLERLFERRGDRL